MYTKKEPCLETTVSLKIPFQSARFASLASDVLNVDSELKGSGVKKDISTNEENLLINLSGQDLKKIRVSANSILKNIILIAKTVNQFESS